MTAGQPEHGGAARPVTPDVVAERHARLRARLAAAGGAGVEVVAVTKGFDVSVARAALDAGLTTLGENYAQELRDKGRELGGHPGATGLRWHYIGPLQRNKVKYVVGRATL